MVTMAPQMPKQQWQYRHQLQHVVIMNWFLVVGGRVAGIMKIMDRGGVAVTAACTVILDWQRPFQPNLRSFSFRGSLSFFWLNHESPSLRLHTSSRLLQSSSSTKPKPTLYTLNHYRPSGWGFKGFNTILYRALRRSVWLLRVSNVGPWVP